MKEALLESQSAKYVMFLHERLRACLRTNAHAYAYTVKKEKVCEKIVREIEKKQYAKKQYVIVNVTDRQTDTQTDTQTAFLKRGTES